MAPSQSKGFNRRQLLGSAAGLIAAGVAPGVDAAQEPEPAEIFDLHSSAPTPAPLNVCAVTARRIAEITARNRIREEAGLPLLSIPKELRRMKNAYDAAEFEAFASEHSAAVCDEVLQAERNRRGQLDWRPTGWMDGMAHQSRVSRILRQQFAKVIR
jgi:hypothetical protein